MEEKIFNNLLHGYPFYFPFWREPLDAQCTLEAALTAKKFKTIPGFQHCTDEQAEVIYKRVKHLFAVYTSGDRAHIQWNESKQAVRAFPNSYREVMGITSPQRSWLPKLI